jgi:hypothetical protein
VPQCDFDIAHANAVEIVKLVGIVKMLRPEIHYQRISRGQAIFEIRIDLKLLKLSVEAEWLHMTGAGKNIRGREVGIIDDDLALLRILRPGPGVGGSRGEATPQRKQDREKTRMGTPNHTNCFIGHRKGRVRGNEGTAGARLSFRVFYQVSF